MALMCRVSPHEASRHRVRRHDARSQVRPAHGQDLPDFRVGTTGNQRGFMLASGKMGPSGGRRANGRRRRPAGLTKAGTARGPRAPCSPHEAQHSYTAGSQPGPGSGLAGRAAAGRCSRARGSLVFPPPLRGCAGAGVPHAESRGGSPDSWRARRRRCAGREGDWPQSSEVKPCRPPGPAAAAPWNTAHGSPGSAQVATAARPAAAVEGSQHQTRVTGCKCQGGSLR